MSLAHLNKHFIIALFAFICVSTNADMIDKNSPIFWKARIGKKIYSGEEINQLLQTGVENKEIGVKCSFRLEKGFEKLTKRLYVESIFTSCDVKGVLVSFDTIGCIQDPKGTLGESRSIRFNSTALEIDIHCVISK